MNEENAESAEENEGDAAMFVVKTTANQERGVADIIEQAVRREGYDIRAILAPHELKGYILVESPAPEIVDQAIHGIHHARAVVRGSSSLSEVEHFLTPRPTVTGILEGSIVELIAGPFKGEKARVKRVDEAHDEVTVELFDAMVPIPVTVRGDHVRVLSKEESD